MKKLALILVLVASITVAFGQKNVRQSASNYLKSGKLDKALEAINTCVLDPSTATDSKSWFIRGNIYLEIYNTKDANFKSLEADPVTKALESYKKAIEFDPKKEYYNDIFGKLNWLRDNYYNQAVDNYNNKLFSEAMSNFGKAAEVLEAANYQDTTSLLNAAACASLANDREGGKFYYQKLLKANYKSVTVYQALSDIYRQDQDSVNALKVIRKGFEAFPGDNRLFLAETNIYLTFNDTKKAQTNLKKALELDPSNYTVSFALGTIYDNISNDTTKSVAERQKAFSDAISTYENALKLNPEYFDGNYNLGALYVNKAAGINDEANKLPLDESAKFDQLTKEATGFLMKALPYLEKAIQLQPNDANTLYTLKQIYTRNNQPDKVKEIQEKINNLQK